ncbi:MAG: pantoate--beta-alanine ligase, partial [Myxococcota bacterium]
ATAGAAAIFAPHRDAMYPPGDQTRVRVEPMALPLCGHDRPVHFQGVATVVAKLFSLLGEGVAVFGRKDYQQWRIINRLAADLFFSVELVGVTTQREPDGLALSSRNQYLNGEERGRAVALSRALREAAIAFRAGERRAAALRKRALDILEPAVDVVDYVSLNDPVSVAPLEQAEVGDRVLLAVAAQLGRARLIDNIVLGEEAPPPGD